MPNCSEETQTSKIEFSRLGRRIVQGRFDGASMTSDAAVMLLGAADRKLGLIDAPARCIADQTRRCGHAALTRVRFGTGLGGFERPSSTAPGRSYANASRCGHRHCQRTHTVSPKEMGR